MIDSTDDGTLTTARRLLIHIAVKEVNQTINADKQDALRDELSALKAELAALTGFQQPMYAYAA